MAAAAAAAAGDVVGDVVGDDGGVAVTFVVSVVALQHTCAGRSFKWIHFQQEENQQFMHPELNSK